jgi:hypothetical protein
MLASVIRNETEMSAFRRIQVLPFSGYKFEVSFFETLVTAQCYDEEVLSVNCTAVLTSDRISVVLIDASVSRLLRVRRYSI